MIGTSAALGIVRGNIRGKSAIMLLLGVMLGTLVMAMYWPMFQLGQVL